MQFIQHFLDALDDRQNSRAANQCAQDGGVSLVERIDILDDARQLAIGALSGR
jgi:hypothetical protein